MKKLLEKIKEKLNEYLYYIEGVEDELFYAFMVCVSIIIIYYIYKLVII